MCFIKEGETRPRRTTRAPLEVSQARSSRAHARLPCDAAFAQVLSPMLPPQLETRPRRTTRAPLEVSQARSSRAHVLVTIGLQYLSSDVGPQNPRF